MDKIVTTVVLFLLVSTVVGATAMFGGEWFEKKNIFDAGEYLLIGILVIVMIAFSVWCLVGLAGFIQDIWG